MKTSTSILLLILATALLPSCFAMKKPEPVIIKIPCHLAELQPMPELQSVEVITDESCPYFLCYEEAEAKKEWKNDKIEEAYIEYVTKTYNAAKRRCSENARN